MRKALRILIIEDSEDDTLLMLHQIKKGGYSVDFKRIDTAQEMKNILGEETWDLILSDYKMPHFNGLRALSILKESGIDIPFIIVSGTIGEELAVEAMKAGAHDYIMKNNLTRLLPAIEREMLEWKNREEKKLLELKHKQFEEALQNSEEQYRTLFENISIGVGVSDMAGKLITFNNAMLKPGGYTHDDIIQIGNVEALYYNYSDREAVISLMKEKGFVNQYPIKFKRKDGSPYDTLLSISMINFKGQPMIQALVEDISERKKSEQVILQSEAKFRTLFEGANDAIFLMEGEDTFTDCNRKSEQIFQCSREEILCRHPYEFSPPSQPDGRDSKEKALEKIHLALSGVPQSFEWTHLKFDGTPFDTEVSLNCIYIGDKVMLQAIVRDITERKKVEEALRHERMLLRLLIDNVPDLMYTKDLACRKTLVNIADVHNMGVKSEAEVLGKDDFAFFPKEMAEKFYADDIAVMQTGQPLINKEEYTLNDLGQEKWFLTSKFPLWDQSGQIIGLAGIGRDITEYKCAEEVLLQSEERFRLLFELSPEAIMLIDPFDEQVDWPIVDCNDAACKINGYSREELIGRSIDIVNTTHGIPEERTEYLNKLRAAPIMHIETFHRHSDGHIFPIEVSTSIVTFLGREMILGIDRDITERKNAEEEIKRKNEQLQKLNAEKDKFFSIIGHDLKSPFGAIVGFSNLLAECAEAKDFDEVEKYAKIVEQSSERAMNLLGNLMDWSRSQTGRMNFNPEYFEISDVISEVELLFTDVAGQKSININKELYYNASVYADKAMIGTVLRNLISNAIKFTKSQGNIFISTIEKENEVVISVQDTGVGVPQSKIEKLFKIDEMYSTLGTQNEKGTGLGLVLCKEFIEKHGGKIWVESIVGVGTTFFFTIPERKEIRNNEKSITDFVC